MSAGIFDRFSTQKGSPSGDSGGQQNPDKNSQSGTSPRVLTSAPQPLRIVKDVLDCIDSLKATFEEEGGPVDDNNQTLHRFCAKLEFLLQFDMKERKSITGRKKDYWDYFCNCIESVKGVNDGIKYVKTVGDCKTSLGKGRAFLRFCLMHHRLADSLQQCVTNGKATSVWYGPNSVWLQHETSSGIISALYDLNEVIFDLAPRGYDLDTAWPSFARVDMMEYALYKNPFVLRKNADGHHSWAISDRSRTSSISSLNSIGQEVYSPSKSNLTANIDSAEIEHLTQELAISENVRSDLADKMEALEQQKSIFQQSIAESHGELSMLETQHKQLQSEYKELQNSYRELEKKYDKVTLEAEQKDKDYRTCLTSAEDKLKESERESESLKESLHKLEKELKQTQEHLNAVMSERDNFEVEIESVKLDLNKVSCDMENKETELKQKSQGIEREKDKLAEEVRALKEERIAETVKTVKIQELLEEKRNYIQSLEKTVSAMKNGFMWLQGLRDIQTYEEIDDLDTMAANILRDTSCFVRDIVNQKIMSEEKLTAFTLEYTSLKDDFEKLKQETYENIRTVDSMKTSASDMKQKEKEMQEKISDFEELLRSKDDKLNEMTKEMKETDRVINEKDKSIIALSAEKTYLVKELETREKVVSKLKDDMEAAQIELQKTREFYNLATKGQSDLIDKLNSQEKLIAEKDNALFELRETERTLLETNNCLRREKESTQTKIGELETEVSAIDESKGACQIELEHTKKELEILVKSKKESDKKQNQQQKKVSKLETENFSLKDSLIQLEDDKQTLSNEMEKERIDHKEILLTSERENEKLTAEMNSTKAHLVHQEGEITLYKSRITDLEGQIATMAKSEKLISERVNSLEKDISSKSFSISSLEKDIDTLSKEKSMSKAENESLQSELRFHQNQIYEKQSEVLLVNEKLERAREELQRTKEFYDNATKAESDLSVSFKSLENSLKEKDTKISELNEIDKKLTIEVTKMQRDNSDLQGKVQNMIARIEELCASNDQRQLQIEELSSSINDLRIEKQQLLKEINDYDEAENSHKVSLESQRLELEQTFLEKADLAQEVEMFKNKELKVSEQNKQLEHKIFGLEQKEVQFGKHLAQMKHEFDIVSKERETLIDKVEALERNIFSNEKEIENLSSECDNMMSLKNSMMDQLSESEKRNRELFDTVERLKLDYDIVSRDKYELEEKVEFLEKTLLNSKNTVDSLNGELTTLESVNKELQVKLECLEQSNIEQDCKIQALKEQVSLLENDKTELNRSIDHLNMSCSEKTKELDNLKNDFAEVLTEKEAKEIEFTNLLKSERDKSDLIASLQEETLCLNSKKCSLEAENSMLLKEKDLLVDRHEKISLELNLVKAERNEIGQNLSTSNENNSKLYETLHGIECQYNELQSEHALLQQAYEKETVSSETLKIESSQLLTNIVSLKEDLSKVTSEHQEAEKKCRNLLEENNHLGTEMSFLSSSVAQLDEKCKSMKTEVSDSFTMILHILNDSLGVFANQEFTLTSEEVPTPLPELLKHLDVACVTKVADMKELRITFENKCSEIDKLLQENKEYKTKERELLKERDEQNTALKKAEGVEIQLQNTINEVEKLNEVIKSVALEKEELSQEFELQTHKYQESINEVEREKDQIKFDILTEKKETETLRTKGNEDTETIKHLHYDLQRLQEEKSAIEKHFSDMESSFLEEKSGLNKDKESLLQEISILKQSLVEAEMTVKENQSVIEEQRGNLHEVQREIKKLEENLTGCQENLGNARESLGQLTVEKERQVDKLTLIINNMESREKELADQVEETQSKLQIANEQIECKSKELDNANRENDCLVEKQVQMTKLIQELSLQVDDVNTKLVDSCAKYEAVKDELKLTVNSLSDTESKLNLMSDEQKQLCNEYEMAKNEHESYKMEVETQLAEKQSSLFSVRDENNMLTEKIEQLHLEKEDINRELIMLTENIGEKDEIISKTNAKLLEAEENYIEKCQKITELDIEIEDGKQSISALQKELEGVAESSQRFEQEILMYQTEAKSNSEKLKELERFQEEHAQLALKIEYLEKSNNETVLSLGEERQKFESLKESADLTASQLAEIQLECQLVKKNKDAEVESLKQEITALEFQLSAEQLQNAEKQKSISIGETEFTEMKDKVMEQESVIDDLQREMENLRVISVQHSEQTHQIETLEQEAEEKDRNIKMLEEKLHQMDASLAKELESSLKVQNTIDDEKHKAEEQLQDKDREISELKEDVDQLKKKLVKLIKEKDSLWQKTDRLAHQHRLHVTEKWMDGSNVTNCLGCNAEFSFTLRKHHCRLCGRIFCYNCSSHWVMTASSSKKLRACTACYIQYSTPTEDVKFECDLEDQSVEIPKRHFIGKTGSFLDTSSVSIASSTASFSDAEEINQEASEGALAISNVIVGNETDEDKLKDTAEKGPDLEGEDKFHVISDEEIHRSLTMSAEYETAAEPEPNMSCSMYLNLEELENGDINNKNEVWIKAGRSFAVPVQIREANTIFGWEFTSYPKDVVFSVTYRQTQGVPYKDAQVLVPPCKCDSHKEATQGELTAKQPGIYTLIFDNTYSKMTAKRVNYTLFSNRLAVGS